MSARTGSRLRLRVRTGKPFYTDAAEVSVEIAGRQVKIKSETKGQPLSKSTWIVFEARGFVSEMDAKAFGEQLQAVVQVAAFATRLGLDAGEGKPTSWFNEDFVRSMGLIQPEHRLVANIHGLSILIDDDNSRIGKFSANATVLAKMDGFADALASAGKSPLHLEKSARGIRILNLAIMNDQPLAQAVLAFSAVEELGQQEKWTASQKELIGSLASIASTDPANLENLEVAAALRRGFQRLGLRQGVMRVLKSLNLYELKDEWDRIYDLRSRVFHGTADLSEAELAQLGHDAIVVAGRVILKLLEEDGVAVSDFVGLDFGPIKGNSAPRSLPG